MKTKVETSHWPNVAFGERRHEGCPFDLGKKTVEPLLAVDRRSLGEQIGQQGPVPGMVRRVNDHQEDGVAIPRRPFGLRLAPHPKETSLASKQGTGHKVLAFSVSSIARNEALRLGAAALFLRSLRAFPLF